MTNRFLNYVTCHCHQGSLDTASTPKAFAKREVELGTGHLTVTDHGTLGSARTVFDLAKKNGLKPIIGLEAYLRDDDCPILKAAGWLPEHPVNKKGEPETEKPKTLAHYAKYFHVTMGFMDQEAYELAVKILSKADGRAERHGSERKPLFTWADLEELGAKNTTMTSSCLIGVVQRHLLAHDNIDNAIAYYERMRGICKPGNFYSEVFPHVCDRNWDSSGHITFDDGTTEKIPSWKKLKLKDGGEAQLQDFAKRWRRGREDQLLAVMENRKWADREPRIIANLEVREGFIVNDCRPWTDDADVQKGCNNVILALAARYGDKVLIGDDSHFAHPEEKVVQDIRLQSGGGSWRFANSYHRQSSEESFSYFRDHMGVKEKEFEGWVENSYAWADKFKDFTFKTRKSLPTSFYPQDTLAHTMSLIEKHGRMRWDNPVWVERLGKEIEMLYQNGTVDLLPYFMIDEEVCEFFNKLGHLTGPGRGSAAGLLLTYLLRITHVDPIKYQLSMERFLTPSRIRSGKYPDIDQDLSKKHRDLLINPKTGFLRQRFGDHYAHISVDTSLKLRSAVKDVARVMHHGKVPEDTEAFTRKFENAPQGISDSDFVFGYKGSDGWVDGSILTDAALQGYVKRYPVEWEIVQKCLGLTRQKAPHACAFVIADEPISNFIPMTSCGDEPVTQYTAGSVEAVGGLKMDFLGLNSLDDIGAGIKLAQKASGWTPMDMVIDGELVLAHEIVPHKGKFYSVWKLPEDQAVFRDICEGKTETVFQFSTPGVQGWMKNFNHIKDRRPDGTVVKAIDSIEALSAFTALDRPGPLDYFVGDEDSGDQHNMLVEFAIRARGGMPTGNLPILDKLLPETYGVIVYQEQLQKVYQVIGKTTAEQADEFRVHISKKQMSKVIEDKATFMPGAIETLGAEVADELWKSLETFGQYGFNKSHATAYVIISYACAFLKHHYPLEWWCAVLRHASKDEISSKFWAHCGHMIDLPDVAKSGDEFEIQDGRIRAPLNLLHGVGDSAHAQLVKYRPYADLTDFCQKILTHKKDGTTKVERKKVEQVVTKTKELRPIRRPVMDGHGSATGQYVETGEMEEVEVESIEEVETTVLKDKVGYNALNKSVIATLVISGAMDSLFPPDSLPVDALTLYNETMAKVQGKKKIDKIDPKYLNTNGFIKYQMRKAVLPAYTELIFPLIERLKPDGWVPARGEERPYFWIKSKKAPFTTYEEIQIVANLVPWPNDETYLVAIPGYVVEARKFNYGEAKAREAMELTIDCDGGRMVAVKWGGKDKLKENFNSDALTGAVVVVMYTKYAEDRPFVVEEIAVIQPPLDFVVEASPDPVPDPAPVADSL